MWDGSSSSSSSCCVADVDGPSLFSLLLDHSNLEHTTQKRREARYRRRRRTCRRRLNEGARRFF